MNLKKMIIVWNDKENVWRSCDSDKIIDIFLFSRTKHIYIFLTLFSKVLINFYLIRTLIFQLSSVDNGQLICRANSISMNYAT
jgi:hypothetical protein